MYLDFITFSWMELGISSAHWPVIELSAVRFSV